MRGGSSKWLVLWSLLLVRLVRQPTLPLRVTDGSHRQYLGISYATVPQKFQAPRPEPKRQGTYEAIEAGIGCTQGFERYFTGQDACLVLNVYTSFDISSKERLPVMFFIHGGGFLGTGSMILFGPEYLVPKGVILVTNNYRLYVQGFLCLGFKEAPGNAAMKDQVAALKWVRRNIKYFGGDPDNVTLIGGAGAVSVSYHLLSPMSKRLFHKAILQSGSVLYPWSLQRRPVYTAGLLAKAMGSDVQEPYDIYSLFMNKTDYELVFTKIPRKERSLRITELIYTPCVEQEIEGVESFITEMSYDTLEKGAYNKVPIIIGRNSEEGYVFATHERSFTPNISIIKWFPDNLVIHSEKEMENIAQELQRLYMDDKDISKETIQKLSKFYGQVYFEYPTYEETGLMLRSNDKPVYNYYFDYGGLRNFVKFVSGRPFIWARGATYVDELFYLFSLRVMPQKLFEDKMINRMTTMWTNFAKFG